MYLSNRSNAEVSRLGVSDEKGDSDLIGDRDGGGLRGKCADERTSGAKRTDECGAHDGTYATDARIAQA